MSGNWREEFTRDFEVPGVIDFLVSKGLLEDVSWHNDVSPSFGFIWTHEPRKHWDPRPKTSPPRPGTPVGADNDIRLWVDHPLASHREVGGKRFMLTSGLYGEAPEEHWEFDELEEALKKTIEQITKHAPAAREGAWSELLQQNEEPEDLLNELVTEYHKGGS